MTRTISSPAAVLAATALLASCGSGADADLAFHRGVNALDEGRADRARIHFAEELELHPERPDSWRLAGEAWMSGTLQSPTRAIAYWRRYLELRPDDVAAATRMTRALFLLGEWREARVWAERLDEGPASHLLRARIFLEADPERARRELAAALEGDDPRRFGLAAEVHQQAGNLDEAAAAAARAVELDPLDLRSTYLLARLRQRRGEAQAAAELLATHQLLARLTGAGSAPEPAPAEALRLVGELEPRVAAEAVEFRRTKLRLLVENGRHGEAREVLAGLAAETGLAPAARLELVGLAEKVGDLATARALLEAVLEEEAEEEGAAGPGEGGRQREALYGLALLAYRQGDRERVRELAGGALERFPHAARFHHLLGRLDLAGERADSASRRFERALELAPWNVDYRVDLANLWLSAGRIEEVEALLAAAPEADPRLDQYRRRHGLS